MSESKPKIRPEIQAAIDRLRATDALGAAQGIQVDTLLIFRAELDYQGQLPPTRLAAVSGRIGYFSVPHRFSATTYEAFAILCTKIGEEQ